MSGNGEPLAYFLTWTTYGTWLPGDERGWVRWGGREIEPPIELFREMTATAMKETAFTLSSSDRQVVAEVIGRHCEIRGWSLYAVNVRSNHVHVVVAAPSYHPKTVRDQFKAWCTRRLKTSTPGRKRFWTEGGSCRWLNRADELDAAIRYTNERQDRRPAQARRASE